PMILYVAMGMQKGEGAPGWSNGYILHNYWGESDFDSEASTAMAIRDIGDSVDGFVENPGYAFWFYVEKFTSQWNDPTYECFAMTHINGSARGPRSEEHTSELQSRFDLVCRLLLEKKKKERAV